MNAFMPPGNAMVPPGTAGTASGLASLVTGRPASELTDTELEAQGTQAHATRNWVFLHGTAEQFARHTSRMLELEQEYLRRHPQRTWQRSGGAAPTPETEVAALREALRGIAAQLEALATEPVHAAGPAAPVADPALAVLATVASAPDGRLHKLEVHQAAREAALDRASLAALYTADEPLLATDRQDRVITDAGRRWLRAAGWRSAAERETGRGDDAAQADPTEAERLSWQHERQPIWDADKQRVIGAAEPGALTTIDYSPGDALPGDWWSVAQPDGRVVGYGWMEVNWGEAEILLAVDRSCRGTGVGSFVLANLERAAAARGLNYVYNTVPASHPHAEVVGDWLGVRGYRDTGDGLLRKQVGGTDPVAQPAATAPAGPSTGGSDRGPGREDSGGYVDVADHQY